MLFCFALSSINLNTHPVVWDITQVDAMNPLMIELGYEVKGESGMPFVIYANFIFLTGWALLILITGPFEHGTHLHFVLYQGTEIIGYAHLQLWPDARVVMRILVVDAAKRNHRYGQHFLLLCERWLKEQGYKSLHVEVSPKALEFYQKNGYSKMSFNDPHGYEGDPQDTALGKILN